MLTNSGITHLKRYLGGSVGSIAQSIAVGLGTSAASANSIGLDFETARFDIDLITYDFEADSLVFKATIPESFRGQIHEIGLYSLPASATSGKYPSQTLVSFDAIENWDGTYSTTNSRVGLDGLTQTTAASQSMTNTALITPFDLSGYSGADQFNFAFNVSNGFTASLRVRLMTDGSNYYDFNFGAQTAGYKNVRVNKSAATATGAPNWGSISQIQVTSTSTAGGSGTVLFDGIRLEDADAPLNENILVARESFQTPFSKIDNTTTDVEMNMQVYLR